MATGRAVELVASLPQRQGDVVSFRRRATTSTPPRLAFEERLRRAGFALAAELFLAYEGTDPTAETDVHAATVVGVLATLAAEFAQAAVALNRRTTAPVAAGGWVLGGEADTILYALDADTGVATVWQLIAAGATDAGLGRQDLPDLGTVLAHTEATIGEKPFPVVTVSSAFRPKALLRAAAARHRHLAQALAADEGLCTPHEQALVIGAAIGEIIRHDQRPAPLTLLAAEVMLGSARLTPLPFAPA